MSKRRKLIRGPQYRGLPINTGANNTLACDAKILDVIARGMEHFLSKHPRALMSRFDMTFPQGYQPNGNEEFKEIMKQSVTSIQRHDGTKPEYVAVREQSKDGGYHYNGILLLDNRVKKSPLKVIAEMERIAEQVLHIGGGEARGNQGVIQLDDNCVVVHRADFEEVGDAFYRASYLAKIKDKGNRGREVFCSKTK